MVKYDRVVKKKVADIKDSYSKILTINEMRNKYGLNSISDGDVKMLPKSDLVTMFN